MWTTPTPTSTTAKKKLSLLLLGVLGLCSPGLVSGHACHRNYDRAAAAHQLTHDQYQYLNEYWKCDSDPDLHVATHTNGLKTPWVVFDTKTGEFAHQPEVVLEQVAHAQCSLFPDTPTAVSSTKGYGAITHQLSGDIFDFSPRLQELCPYAGFGSVFSDHCDASESACALPTHDECKDAIRDGAVVISTADKSCENAIFRDVHSREAFWNWRLDGNPHQFNLQELCVFDAFYICVPTLLTTQEGWTVYNTSLTGSDYVVYLLNGYLWASAANNNWQSSIFFSLRITHHRRKLLVESSEARRASADANCVLYLSPNVAHSLDLLARGLPAADLVSIQFPSSLDENGLNDDNNIYVRFHGHPHQRYTVAVDLAALTAMAYSNLQLGVGFDMQKKLLVFKYGNGVFDAAFRFPSDAYYNTYANGTYTITFARSCDRSIRVMSSDDAVQSVNRVWSDAIEKADDMYTGFPFRMLSDVFRPASAYGVSVGNSPLSFNRVDGLAIDGLLPKGAQALPNFVKRAACTIFLARTANDVVADENAFYIFYDFVAARPADLALNPIDKLRIITHTTLSILLGGPNNKVWNAAESIFLPRDSASGASSSNFVFGCSTDAAGIGGINGCALYLQADNQIESWSGATPPLNWALIDRIWPNATASELEVGLLCDPRVVVDIRTVPAVATPPGP